MKGWGLTQGAVTGGAGAHGVTVKAQAQAWGEWLHFHNQTTHSCTPLMKCMNLLPPS
jgi:hypothetical protein